MALKDFAGVFSRDPGEERRNAGQTAFNLTGSAIALVLVLAGDAYYQLT